MLIAITSPAAKTTATALTDAESKPEKRMLKPMTKALDRPHATLATIRVRPLRSRVFRVRRPKSTTLFSRSVGGVRRNQRMTLLATFCSQAPTRWATSSLRATLTMSHITSTKATPSPMNHARPVELPWPATKTKASPNKGIATTIA